MSSLMFPNLVIGKSFDIRLRAPAILGDGYSKARVMAILDYSTAAMLEDVAALHQQAYPELPSGTPFDPGLLIYIKLMTTAGNVIVIAQDWIAAEPTDVEYATLVVTITNTDVSRIPALRAILHGNNFPSFQIEAR